jgi:hypothetical protein
MVLKPGKMRRVAPEMAGRHVVVLAADHPTQAREIALRHVGVNAIAAVGLGRIDTMRIEGRRCLFGVSRLDVGWRGGDSVHLGDDGHYCECGISGKNARQLAVIGGVGLVGGREAADRGRESRAECVRGGDHPPSWPQRQSSVHVAAAVRGCRVGSASRTGRDRTGDDRFGERARGSAGTLGDTRADRDRAVSWDAHHRRRGCRGGSAGARHQSAVAAMIPIAAGARVWIAYSCISL